MGEGKELCWGRGGGVGGGVNKEQRILPGNLH